MEKSVNVFGKSESPRSPTRLQRQAPTALHLDGFPHNPFLQKSCDDAVTSTAIPLLSPLIVSPNPQSSGDFMFPVGITEKNGSQPSMDHKEGYQHTANVSQVALLTMFLTNFVLVDHSQ